VLESIDDQIERDESMPVLRPTMRRFVFVAAALSMLPCQVVVCD